MQNWDSLRAKRQWRVTFTRRAPPPDDSGGRFNWVIEEDGDYPLDAVERGELLHGTTHTIRAELIGE